jgi:type IV secretory pathway TrbD component
VVSPIFGGLAYETLGITAPLWIAAGFLVAMALFGLRSRRLAAPHWDR